MLNYDYKCCNIPPRPSGDEMKNSLTRRWKKKKKNFERMKRAGEKKWKLRSKIARKEKKRALLSHVTKVHPSWAGGQGAQWERGGVSIDGKLGSEVVEDLVGGSS